jgi:hypothetical protein
MSGCLLEDAAVALGRQAVITLFYVVDRIKRMIVH